LLGKRKKLHFLLNQREQKPTTIRGGTGGQLRKKKKRWRGPRSEGRVKHKKLERPVSRAYFKQVSQTSPWSDTFYNGRKNTMTTEKKKGYVEGDGSLPKTSLRCYEKGR